MCCWLPRRCQRTRSVCIWAAVEAGCLGLSGTCHQKHVFFGRFLQNTTLSQSHIPQSSQHLTRYLFFFSLILKITFFVIFFHLLFYHHLKTNPFICFFSLTNSSIFLINSARAIRIHLFVLKSMIHITIFTCLALAKLSLLILANLQIGLKAVRYFACAL